MACRRRNVKLDAIYVLINNLIANEDLNVQTFEDVQAWFKQNYPTIQTKELIDSLIITDPKEVEESKRVLNQRKANIRSEARMLAKLGLFLNNIAQRHANIPRQESQAEKQIKNAIKEFKELAKKDNLTTSDYESLQSLVEALPISEGINTDTVESVINTLKGLAKQKAEQRDKARIDRMTEKLDKLFSGKLERNVKKPMVPPSKEVEQFEKILKELYSYAARNEDVANIKYAEIMQGLSEIDEKYKEFYDKPDGPEAIAAIQQAVENYHRLRDELKVDGITKRLAKIDANIERLNAWEKGEDVDITDLVTDSTSTPYRKTSKEVLELEHKIAEAKEFIEGKIDDIRRQQKINKALDKVLGDYKLAPKTVKGMLEFWYKMKDFAWELPRTLNFMLDASFFGVQLMPVMAMELFSPVTHGVKNIRRKPGEDHIPIFQGWHRAATVFRDGFWAILKEEVGFAFGQARKGKFQTKTAKGDWARRMYAEIAHNPLFDLMMKAGLKISRSKSLTNSEEYFKSSIVNKIPVAGWIKDVSEDTMVTVLNMYRAMMFEQFYKNNPGLDVEEYARAAESINNMTGTTNRHGQVLAPAALAFSAPRLLYARLRHVGYLIPHSVGLAISTGRELSGKEVDVVDKYVRQNTVGSMTAILGIYALMAGIGTVIPGFIKVGSDWEDKDFMRIQIGSRSFDPTGGIGAIVRFMANFYLYQHGPGENASYATKARLTYLRNVLRFDSKTAIFQFGFSKAHPTVNALLSIWSGKDYMGSPMRLPGRSSTNEVETRVAALGKMFLPISVQTAGEDPSLASVIPQFFGINVINYDDSSKTFMFTDWVNEKEYKPKISYPTELKKIKGKEVDEDDTTVIFLKKKYAEEWGKILGDLVVENPDITKSNLNSKLSSAEQKLKREFREHYKEELKNLPVVSDAKKKQKEKEKKERDAVIY